MKAFTILEGIANLFANTTGSSGSKQSHKIDDAIASVVMDATRIFGETTLQDMLDVPDISIKVGLFEDKENALRFDPRNKAAVQNADALRDVQKLLIAVDDLRKAGSGSEITLNFSRGIGSYTVKFNREDAAGSPIFEDGRGYVLNQIKLGTIIGFSGIDHTQINDLKPCIP